MEEPLFSLALEDIFDGLLGSTPAKTRHAEQRQRERGISDHAIIATLRWGRAHFRRDGRREYELDMARTQIARSCGEDVEPYVGTVVIVGSEGGVITVFRRSALS